MNRNTCEANLDVQAYLDKQMGPEDRLFLEQHVKNCSECLAQIETFQTLFKKIEVVSKRPFSQKYSTEKIDRIMRQVENAAKPLSSSEPTSSTFGLPLNWFAWTGVFASVCILLLFGSFFSKPPATYSPEGNKSFYSYALSAASKNSLVRQDSPKVALGTTGKLEFDTMYQLMETEAKLRGTMPDGKIVELYLKAVFQLTKSGVSLREGAVLCDLPPNSAGFVVDTRFGSVTSHGTKFQVELLASEARIILKSGKIMIASKSQERFMDRPGILILKESGNIEPEKSRQTQQPVPENHPNKLPSALNPHPTPQGNSSPDSINP